VSIEPSIAATVENLEVFSLTDWAGYRVCPICRSTAGTACTAMWARVENGQRAGGPVALQVPHAARKRSRRR
jgi:hypothetical protein